jgi:hypothetical protein
MQGCVKRALKTQKNEVNPQQDRVSSVNEALTGIIRLYGNNGDSKWPQEMPAN